MGANWGSEKGKKLRGATDATLQSILLTTISLERERIRLWLELPSADGADLMSTPAGVGSTSVAVPTSLWLGRDE